MPQLSIQDFSCIKSAHIDLTPITLVIGPQASGKSLISKLLYFFADVVQNQYSYAERGESIKPFLKSIGSKFLENFPSNAWGDGIFNILYQAKDLKLEVSRKKVANRLSHDVVVSASTSFEKQYSSYFSAVQRITRRNPDEDDPFFDSFSPQVWNLRRTAVQRLIQNLEADYIEAQLFIPAGRSFYTNLGKAVAMFEFGSQLDDVTKRFGRRFTSMLDGQRQYYLPDKVPARTKEFLKNQKLTQESILGGKLKLSSGEKYLETRDGRIIPLSMMSSGQQELLPLLLALQAYTGANADDKDPSVDVLYIEEPEAHLFPTAQAALVHHLVTVANFLAPRSRLFITTHSPYVLSTLNNIVKSFEVASLRPDSIADIVKISPRASWLPPAALSAYALEDGILKSIKDKSGLIDGEYLDKISDEISATFLNLLEIEVTDD